MEGKVVDRISIPPPQKLNWLIDGHHLVRAWVKCRIIAKDQYGFLLLLHLLRSNYCLRCVLDYRLLHMEQIYSSEKSPSSCCCCSSFSCPEHDLLRSSVMLFWIPLTTIINQMDTLVEEKETLPLPLFLHYFFPCPYPPYAPYPVHMSITHPAAPYPRTSGRVWPSQQKEQLSRRNQCEYCNPITKTRSRFNHWRILSSVLSLQSLLHVVLVDCCCAGVARSDVMLVGKEERGKWTGEESVCLGSRRR